MTVPRYSNAGDPVHVLGVRPARAAHLHPAGGHAGEAAQAQQKALPPWTLLEVRWVRILAMAFPLVVYGTDEVEEDRGMTWPMTPGTEPRLLSYLVIPQTETGIMERLIFSRLWPLTLAHLRPFPYVRIQLFVSLFACTIIWHDSVISSLDLVYLLQSKAFQLILSHAI